MGFFDKKSTTVQQTSVFNTNLNQQGISAPNIVGDGNRIDYSVTDAGAVAAAFDAIDKEGQRTADLIKTVNADALVFADRVSQTAYDWADEVTRSEVSKGFDTLIQWGTGAVSLVALAWIFGGK